MKKYSLISFVLIICLFLSTISFADTPVYYHDYAEKLSEIGVFKGSGNSFELEREPTRLEGLIMLIRLLGKEADADKLKNEPCVFADVPSWAAGYANYAYLTGLAKGMGNGKFGAIDLIDANGYLTFMLRALGYDDSENKDFDYKKSTDFAMTIGLLEEDLYFKIVRNPFIRDYMAKCSYNALLHPVKDNSSTLLDKLVSAGAFTQEQASRLKFWNTSQQPDGKLSSIEIGKLADAVVLIEATGYNGSTWSGSGFYISSDGNIVTNFHVVEGAKSLKITENNDQTYTGRVKVIAYSEDLDIAVLDIDKKVDLFLTLGDSSKVALGEEIYTIGSPFGLKNTISTGIISSIRNGIFQISAPISRGSSGGVLLNTKGQAIGVTYAGIEAGENLGFAIPINQVISLPKNLSLDLAAFNSRVNKAKSYDEYEEYLLDKYSILEANGYTTQFIAVHMEGDSNTIYTFMFLDQSYLTDFLGMMASGKSKVEKEVAEIAADIASYYRKDVSLSVIYVDSYYQYPVSFEENDLYPDTITYDPATRRWIVFYPYLAMNLDHDDNTYFAMWAY